MQTKKKTAKEVTKADVETFVRCLHDLKIYDQVQKICLKYGVTDVEEIVRSSTLRFIANARHEAMVFIHTRFGWTYQATARFFCRDHSTLIGVVKKWRASEKARTPRPKLRAAS